MIEVPGIVVATPANYNGISLIFGAEQVLRGGAAGIWIRSESAPSDGDIRVIRNLCRGYDACTLVDSELFGGGAQSHHIIHVVEEGRLPPKAGDNREAGFAVILSRGSLVKATDLCESNASLFIVDIRDAGQPAVIAAHRESLGTLSRVCFFLPADAMQVSTCAKAGACLIAIGEDAFLAPDPSTVVRSCLEALAAGFESVVA